MAIFVADVLVETIAPAVDTILIVDDDTARAARIGQVLSLHGYGVLHACSGHAAVDLAREHRPPLVLVSVTTTRGDHADLCRQLQSDWRCGSPSIIILAGRADVAEFASGLATTADDYVILEPFDAVRVLTRIAATLRRSEEMRASSPLTGLPGNTAIETELQRRTSVGEPMALLYIDLDNFKAFNDHYGFLRGDAVLRGVAEVLRGAAEKRPGTFLGHVGGDDFVVVSTPEDAEDIANEITAGVDEQAPFFYDPEDVDRGGIEVMDRRGVPHNYPFVTVSIGVAVTQEGQVGDHRALVDVATEMKQYAKTLPGSVAAVDRRSDDDRGVGQHHPLQRGRPVARLGPGRLPGRPHRQSRMRWVTTLVSALLLPFFMLGPAFAANSAAPGDALWPAKLTLESMRLTLATSPVRDVALHLDFAYRRLDELTGLLAVENPDSGLVEVVTSNFEEHLKGARQGLNVLNQRGEGRQTAQLQTRAVVVEVQSQSVVRRQCGTGTAEVPAPAAVACQKIQRALPTVNEIALMIAPEAEGIVTAIAPAPNAMGPPPSNGSSNTATTTADPAAESSKVGSESGTGTTTGKQSSGSGDKPAASGGDKQARSGGNDPAGSSGKAPAPADPSQPPAETAASPNPEPTPEPTPSPTETPTATEDPSPEPPGHPDGAPPRPDAATSPQPKANTPPRARSNEPGDRRPDE
ncbi:MAG: diguanylate cyclase [Actinomycetota bacterium]|nr:diguanylate cyclase [Actinomycetota bacterium]